MIDSILFVCTGNTCRSSMAEGLFKKIIENDDLLKNIKVLSAGTSVYYETCASDGAINALDDFGISLKNFKSKPITEDVINIADLILTMTSSHKNRVIDIVPTAINKTYTLKEYVESSENDYDITDPYGADLEYYKKCSKEIYEKLVKLSEKLKSNHNMDEF